ncbi:MAG TPA: hypothetical protein VMT59_13590 [Gaiellaceae bacterium]|nr:hypothetical protein [Gaiellaceae bacterium]
MRRLRFHARPVTWLIAAGVGVAIATRHRSLRRSKAEQAAVDRRARHDRRSGVERRSGDGTPPGDERRSGEDRRSGVDRRHDDSV